MRSLRVVFGLSRRGGAGRFRGHPEPHWLAGTALISFWGAAGCSSEFDDRDLAADAVGDDLRGLGGTTKRGCVDRGLGRLEGEPFSQRRGLREAQLGQLVVNDLVRHL